MVHTTYIRQYVRVPPTPYRTHTHAHTIELTFEYQESVRHQDHRKYGTSSMNMAWEGLLVQWWLVSFEFVFLNRCCYIVLSYGLVVHTNELTATLYLHVHFGWFSFVLLLQFVQRIDRWIRAWSFGMTNDWNV